MAEEKEKLGKVVAKLKIQLWADDILVAESFDEKMWSRILGEMPLANELKEQREQLQEVVQDLQTEAKNLKAAKKAPA